MGVQSVVAFHWLGCETFSLAGGENCPSPLEWWSMKPLVGGTKHVFSCLDYTALRTGIENSPYRSSQLHFA